MAGLAFNMLPEDCVAEILSLTSPPDACRSSAVSSSFRLAADSDTVWDRFLPFDWHEIVSRSLTPLKFSKKKELFFLLCKSILIDGGHKSFGLEESFGRKSYILSARELSISLSNEPSHWSWKSFPLSRFSVVAELVTASRLEIQGNIRTQMLTPNTTYSAYMIMKISDHAFGLDSIPWETSVEVGDSVIDNTAYLRHSDSKNQQMECLFYMNRMEMFRRRVNKGDGRVPLDREDGWMEIEIGEFFTSEGNVEVKMSIMEVKGHQLKGGLIIEGIEVMPTRQFNKH